MAERWGPGDREAWKYLDQEGQFQDGTPFRLFFGEHPHSRSDKTLYADLGDDAEPVAFDGHRVRTKIVIEEANYLKVSGVSGSEIRKQCWADIVMNDRLVYRYQGPRNATDVLLKAREVLLELFELPVQLWQPDFDGLVGRKIFYRNHPAVVDDYWPDQGCVYVRSEEGLFPAAPWDPEPIGAVKDEILSPHIWWFRGPRMCG